MVLEFGLLNTMLLKMNRKITFGMNGLTPTCMGYLSTDLWKK
jgi:hypothetical protein